MHGPPGHPNPLLDSVDPATRDVVEALRAVMGGYRRLTMRMLADLDISPAQAACLRQLATQDGVSQSELATSLHISRPSITSVLQKMERAGLIERRTDELDQRMTRVFLTEAGRAALAGFGETFSRVAEMSAGSMPEADLAELTRLLRSLETNITGALETLSAEKAPNTGTEDR